MAKFSDLVDVEILQQLWNSFSEVDPIATAIIDLEGNVLVAAHWQRICTVFHRVNPDTLKRCIESNTELANGLNAGNPYNVYRCKNGLVEVAVPIIINGKHLANFFTGQFFFEAPDKEYFIKQAEEFGFDQEDYLAALAEVPVIDEEKLKTLMNFLVKQVQVLAMAGEIKLNLLQSNKKLKEQEIKLEELVHKRTLQLKIIDEFQTQFIVQTDPFEMYDKLLDNLLKLTNSPFGLIGEVVFNADKQLCLKTYALTNIAWDKETNELYNKYKNIGFEFTKLDNLFGTVVTQKKVVLTNDPKNNSRSGGVPHGHPPIESFLGIPVFYGQNIVGEIGLANRPGGYDEDIVDLLKPLAKTCGQIIVARQEKEAHAIVEKKLKEQASLDGLTGIYNRRYFDEYFDQEWRRAVRAKAQMSMIMVDIDYFKLYNDNYGHLEGDECLKKVASVLHKCILRPADMVARYGGEEFVCLLPDTSKKGAIIEAECFMKKLKDEAMKHESSTVSNLVTISIGIATIKPTKGMDLKTLIDMVDKNLYKAKDEGRNRIVS